MAIDKPKLSPESIRTLLALGLKHAETRYSYKDRWTSIFDFFKLLAVSKSYLNTSRKASYHIYYLTLNYYQRSDSIAFSVKSKSSDSYGRPELLFENAYNLFKFLQPPYICADLDYYPATKIEKLTKILQATNGKVSLETGRYNENEKVQLDAMISKFMHRIYSFACNPKFLNTEEMYSFPPLDRLSISFIENSQQVERILRYKAKELKLCIPWKRNFEIPANITKNMSVKKFELNFDHVEYDDVKRMSIGLHKLCPNAKQLSIKAYIHGHQMPLFVTQVPNIIAIYGQRMQNLKTQFENDVFDMSIEIGVYFHGEFRDRSWTQKVIENAIFRGWDRKFDLTEIDDYTNCHELTMKFTNGNFNFIIVATVCFGRDRDGHEEYLELYGQEAYDKKYNYEMDFLNDMNTNENGSDISIDEEASNGSDISIDKDASDESD